MNQLSMEEIQGLKTRIATALVALKSEYFAQPTDLQAAIPTLAEFYPDWHTPRDVPVHLLERTAKSLEAEVGLRKQHGEAAYFDMLPIKAKLDLYELALLATALDLEQAYREPVDPITFVEFKLLFAKNLRTQIEERTAEVAAQSGARPAP